MKPITDQSTQLLIEAGSPQASISSSVPTDQASVPEKFADNDRVYTNTRYGFSMNIPLQVIQSDAGCVQSESSAELKKGMVNVQAYENGDSVIIAPVKHYELSADEKTCIEVIHTPQNVADEAYYRWIIRAFPARNDAEINAWLQQHIGLGCEVIDFEPALQEGVRDLSITMILDSDERPCYTNHIHTLLYSPQKAMAYYLQTGQESAMWSSFDFMSSYDEEMIATFRIE